MTRQVMLRVAMVLLAPAVVLGQSALETYQRALVQDQAAGNLKDAILLYRRAGATDAAPAAPRERSPLHPHPPAWATLHLRRAATEESA